MPLSNVENHISNLLRIGVTGHRFLAETNKIRAGVDSVCDTLARSFPTRPWQIISPLAEGADRLVASVLINRGASLVALLPMPREDYQQDFVSETSRQEFFHLLDIANQVIEIPYKNNRLEAYRQIGHFVIDNCDVLIAIWDGHNAQGKGGTGEFVALARQRKKPVAWIHAGNCKPGISGPDNLGKDQGKVDFLGFPE
jgi:hypothetical protein